MRHLFFCFLFLSLSAAVPAQEMVLPVGVDAEGSAVFLAVEGDSILAFALEKQGSLHFWSKKGAEFVKVGQQSKSPLAAYVGSICTPDKVKFIFNENHAGTTQYEFSRYGGRGQVTAALLNKAEGKPVDMFIHDGSFFNITFLKKTNVLRVRRYEADGREVNTEYVLPKTKGNVNLNTVYADLKKLRYRSTGMADPSVLYKMHHIFIVEDAIYLVHPRAVENLGFFTILKLGLKDQSVVKHIIQPRNVSSMSNANLYFSNHSFLLYTISQKHLSLTEINPVNWSMKEFYSLDEREEKLQNVSLRQESTKMWWSVFSDGKEQLDQKRLLSKLNKGDAYVYINPLKDSSQVREIVLGSYAEYNHASGGFGAGGGFAPMTTYRQVVHPYVMLQYDKEAATIQPTPSVWKSPTAIWDEMLKEMNPAFSVLGIGRYNAAPAIHHLGDRALIAYIDKKREAVIVRYESLVQKKQL